MSSETNEPCTLPVTPVTPIQRNASPLIASTRRIAASFFRRRRALLMLTVLGFLVVGLAITLTTRHVYQSVAQIRLYSANGFTADSQRQQQAASSRAIATESAILANHDFQQDVFADLEWNNKRRDFGGPMLNEDLVDVHALPGTDIISITVRAYNPKAAAALANALARVYLTQDVKDDVLATQKLRVAINDNIKEAASKLEKANIAVAKFKQQNNLYAPEAQLTRLTDYLLTLQTERDKAFTELAAAQQSLNVLRGKLRAEKPGALNTRTLTHDPRYMSLLATLDKLNSDRAALLEKSAPDSKEVKELDQQIHDTEQQVKSLANATIVSAQTEGRNPIYDTLAHDYLTTLASQAAASARITAFDTIIRARQREMVALPAKQKQLGDLLRNADVLDTSYKELLSKDQALLVHEESAMPHGVQVAQAHAILTPIRPQILRSLLLWILAGGIVGLTLALVIDRRDETIHSIKELQEISTLPILGTIPEITVPSEGIWNELPQCFVALRRMLRSQCEGNIIAITSPGAQEGKSLISAYLATSLAKIGKRVLLIDTHFAAPAQHQFCAIPDAPGLGESLDALNTLSANIVPTECPGLYCLPAGITGAESIDTLDTEQGKQIIRRLAAEYDIVLLDCPPASNSDMLVLASLASSVVLVAALGIGKRSQLSRALQQLTYIKAQFAGIVINRTELS